VYAGLRRRIHFGAPARMRVLVRLIRCCYCCYCLLAPTMLEAQHSTSTARHGTAQPSTPLSPTYSTGCRSAPDERASEGIGCSRNRVGETDDSGSGRAVAQHTDSAEAKTKVKGQPGSGLRQARAQSDARLSSQMSDSDCKRQGRLRVTVRQTTTTTRPGREVLG
jgi:hypothetical protein